MELSEAQGTARAIKLVQDRHHRELDRRLRTAGTTLSQWDALRAIGQHAGASTHELAVLTFMTDQSFGALAIKLADRSLVVRTPGRGRIVHHDLTPSGRTLLATATELVEDVLAASFAPLSSADRARLRELLETLAPHSDEAENHRTAAEPGPLAKDGKA